MDPFVDDEIFFCLKDWLKVCISESTFSSELFNHLKASLASVNLPFVTSQVGDSGEINPKINLCYIKRYIRKKTTKLIANISMQFIVIFVKFELRLKS